LAPREGRRLTICRQYFAWNVAIFLMRAPRGFSPMSSHHINIHPSSTAEHCTKLLPEEASYPRARAQLRRHIVVHATPTSDGARPIGDSLRARMQAAVFTLQGYGGRHEDPGTGAIGQADPVCCRTIP
jgi:hypothetical protein